MTESAQEVFYSYAHTDEQFRKLLIKQLSNLSRQGLITEWYDRKIIAGTEWASEIDIHLNSATLILLLVSPDFIASEYCYSIEMKRAMERHEAREAHVIPIILRPTDCKGTPFEKLQSLPTNGKPVTTWRNRDEAFVDIVQGIRQAIEELHSSNTKKQDELAVQYEHYCTKINECWKMLDFKGVMHVEMNRPLSIPLTEVFIYPDVLTGTPEYETVERELEKKEGKLKKRDADQQSDEGNARSDRSWKSRRPAIVQREPLQAVLTKNSRLIILGDPGSGKSTLLRYLMLKLAEKDETFPTMFPFAGAASFIPLYITLATYADFWRTSPAGERTLRHFLPKHLNDNYLENYVGLVQHFLEKGRVVVLLDGLDEIPDASLRIQIVRQIEAFTQTYSANRFIITSRIVGYKEAPLAADYQPHTLADFSEQQIKKFTQKWCPAYERWVRGTEDGRYVHDATKEAEKLFAATHSNPGVKRLAVNPLMLTILALIQRQGRDLPSHRVELFDLCAKTLLETWVRARGRTTRLSKNELVKILRPLAFWMHSHPEVGAISEEDLTKRVILQLCERGITEDEAAKRADQFLQTVRDETGILIERGKNRYGFLHLTFEEYFAASHLEQDEEQVSFIRQHLHESRWREVIRLTVGIVGIIQDNERGVTKLIQEAILNADSPYEKWLHRDLLFAALCLTDDIGINEIQENKIIAEIAYLYLTSPYDPLRNSFADILKAWSRIPIGVKAAKLVLSLFSQPITDVDIATSSLPPFFRQFRRKLIAHYTYLSEKQKEIQIKLLYFLADVALQSRGTDRHYEEIIFHPASNVRQVAASILGKLGDGQPEVVLALLRMVGDFDSEVRQVVASMLGEVGVGNSEVVEALLGMVRDADWEVRQAVTSALGELGKGRPEVAEVLMGMLGDDDPDVREAVVSALGQLGKGRSEVVEVLLRMLGDDDSGVREAVASALGKVGKGQSELVEALLGILEDANSDVKKAVASMLGLVGKGRLEVVKTLVGMVGDADWEVRQSVASALGQIGKGRPEVAEALMGMLGDDDPDVREAVANALGQLGKGQPEVARVLLGMVGDDDPDVRQVAASVLGLVGKGRPEVVETLVGMVGDADSDVRQAATNALGLVGEGNPKVVEMLLMMVGDPDGGMRQTVASALGQVGEGNPKVVGVLLGMVGDVNGDVGQAAASALGQMKRKMPDLGENIAGILFNTSPADLVQRNVDSYNKHIYETFVLRQIKFLEQVGGGQRKVVETLLKMVSDPSLSVRLGVVSALGQLGRGHQEVVETLLGMVRHSDIIVRIEVSIALGKVGEEGNIEVVGALLEMMKDPTLSVRQTAVNALGQVGRGHLEVVETLLGMIGGSNRSLEFSAAVALCQIARGQPEVIKALLKMVGSSDSSTRRTIADALRLTRGENSELVVVLLGMVGDLDPNVRQVVAGALGGVGEGYPEVVGSLLGMIEDSDGSVRQEAAGALGRVGGEQVEVVVTLLRMVSDLDPNVRGAAASVLGQVGEGESQVVEGLLKLVGDADENVRGAAASALGQVGEGEPQVVEALLKLVGDADENVRGAAARSLGQIGEGKPEVVGALLKMVGDSDRSVRWGVASALEQIGEDEPEVVVALLRMVGDSDLNVRREVARALGQVGEGNPDVVEALLQYLKDSFVGRTAARALAMLQVDCDTTGKLLEGQLTQPRNVVDDLVEAHYAVNNLVFALQQIMGET